MALSFKLGFMVFCFVGLFACSKTGNDSNTKPNRGTEPSEFSSSPGDCKAFIADLPSSYFHDWISVPENPFDVSSPQIQVFYYGPKQLTDNVVAFYNGGPGSSSHGVNDSFDREIQMRGLQQKISFIYIDQRGTGCSSGFPKERSVTDIFRARWYGSTGIVYDSEAIRQKILGGRKWKVFGQSYGAFIVHRYAALFPESLQAAFAHANTINADGEARQFSRIYSQYRVLNMYLEQYPEDRPKLVSLKNYLVLSKCFKTQFIGDVCGQEVLMNMITSLGFSNRWSRLHETIQNMVQETGPDDKAIQAYLINEVDEEEPETGYSMSVIGFFDRNTSTNDYTVCNTIYEKLKKQNITEDQLLMNECMQQMQTHAVSKVRPLIEKTLDYQHDHLTLEKFKAGLLKMTPHTFYLYSGEKDAFVPKENFGEETSALGDLLNYTHFMNSGHEGYRTENKVWEDLVRVAL